MSRKPKRDLVARVWEVAAEVTKDGRLLDLNHAYYAAGEGVTAYFCGHCGGPIFAVDRAESGRGGSSSILKCHSCDLLVRPNKKLRTEVQFTDSVRTSFFQMVVRRRKELRTEKAKATRRRIGKHTRAKEEVEAKYR